MTATISPLFLSQEEFVEKYHSKADAFILPLTGLSNMKEYHMRSYLFWNDISIHDLKLILTFTAKDTEKFDTFARKNIFPILDKNGYLLESYVEGNLQIFILDLSEWNWDIDNFLLGKYSKFSAEAKKAIEIFHKYEGANFKVPFFIYAILNPSKPTANLDNKTPIAYAAQEYGFNLSDLQEVGELGSIYDKNSETLTLV